MMSFSANSRAKMRIIVYTFIFPLWCLLLLAIPGMVESNISLWVCLSSWISAHLFYLQNVLRAMVFLDLSTSLGHFKVFFGNLAYFAILIGFVLANKFFENHVLIVSSAMLFFGYVARAFNADDLQSLRNSLTEVYRELKRINWPSHAETLKFVGVVATFVAVSAIFWWIMDGLITRVLSFLLQLLS